jgi:hypothetical protein
VATVEQSYWSGGELRDALRAATHGAHERLHRHPGLAAIAKGKISRLDYCNLLTRLLGFSVPFELTAFEANPRSRDSLIEAACDTFGAFEHWLAGWSGRPA